MRELPNARAEGVVTEWVDDELVVYDEVSHTAHCLSTGVASVWERCNGRLSPAELARSVALPLEAVERALIELGESGLLDDEPLTEEAYSRRQAVMRLAKVGGAAVTAPLIYSVVVGSAAAAGSVCVTNGNAESGCTAATGAKAADANCCSGTCYRTGSGSKICVASTCNLAGLGCLVSGASCCSGVCFLAFCTT